jgi:PIN domain nuclease of toxin-antitoxin system
MESGESVLLVSAASVWEMAIKTSLGKLELPQDLLEVMDEQGFQILEVTGAHAWAVSTLPLGDHKDPFDRQLVTQALLEDLPVISGDSELDEYGIKRHW